LISLIAVLSLMEKGAPLRVAAVAETVDAKRIAFRIATIEQHGATENLLSQALIEGPSGTDFTVKLNSARFRLKASFLTDLTTDGALSIRANLDTRRLYGYSEKKLPLYEEDEQRLSFTLGFDEQIVLLPFGRKDDDDQLRITIVPAWSEQSGRLPTGEPRPLTISILKETDGSISIEASKKPHHFEVSAALLEDGREIARSAANSQIEQASELLLASQSEGAENLVVKLTVDNYIRNRPTDQASLSFDIDRVSRADSKRQPVISNWAGVCLIGKPLTYDLTGFYRGEPGRKYELQLTTKLASDESVQ
jgi:hypothetical protein